MCKHERLQSASMLSPCLAGESLPAQRMFSAGRQAVCVVTVQCPLCALMTCYLSGNQSCCMC